MRAIPIIVTAAVSACSPPIAAINADVQSGVDLAASKLPADRTASAVALTIACGGTLAATGTYSGREVVTPMFPLFDLQTTFATCSVGTGAVLDGSLHVIQQDGVVRTLHGSIVDHHDGDWSCDVDVTGTFSPGGDTRYDGTICGQPWSYDDQAG